MIAEHPYAVVLAMMTLVIISGLFSFVPELNAPDLPDFSTPVMVKWQRLDFVGQLLSFIFVSLPFDGTARPLWVSG